ncbi:hypothetical protein WS86_00210 (plasmid) [Burkholderia savannae]|uniref:Adenylosuccinate synthase n=1 Tax=Burkholderia savannae TaxID=1637837 RepID=A0ABR5T8H3_9BURK|nr:hypothetical protein [Burkholderia savannae]AOJ79201.1 hypothetical protein WS86_00210 [Burkholderia savannae]KWZ39534.1 hypothetical protein WS72_19170 [Burkholderia savannae]
MAGQLSHAELVELSARHVKKIGFPVVGKEVRAWYSREEGDVIAFRSTSSLLVEAKCSRSDFRADARKPERTNGGLGVYRFYVCPAGLIHAEEVPERWGLWWVDGRKITQIKGPVGNHWPPYNAASTVADWARFMHQPDVAAERAVMFSIARRRSLSRSDERYEAMLHDARRRADQLARNNDALAEQNRELQAKLVMAKNGYDGDRVNEMRTAIRRKVTLSRAKV